MKTRHLTFADLCIPGAFLLLAVGCTKTTTTQAPTNGTLSAAAGGTSFTAQVVDAAYSQGLGLVGVFGITQKGNDSTKIILEFSYLPPAGLTFSSDTTETSLSYFTGGKQYDAFSNSGKVVMTLATADTVGHLLSGSFSGTVYNEQNPLDSLLISNGKFTSSYSVQP